MPARRPFKVAFPDGKAGALSICSVNPVGAISDRPPYTSPPRASNRHHRPAIVKPSPYHLGMPTYILPRYRFASRQHTRYSANIQAAFGRTPRRFRYVDISSPWQSAVPRYFRQKNRAAFCCGSVIHFTFLYNTAGSGSSPQSPGPLSAP